MAIEEARQKAYEDFSRQLQENHDKIKEIDEVDERNNVHEIEEDYDESLRRLGYPEEKKEEAIQAREAGGSIMIEQ